MPALILPEEAHRTYGPPVASPFDEGVWNAWIAEGIKRDQRKSAEHRTVAKWLVVVALIAAAVLLPNLEPFDLPVRCFISGIALLTMYLAFREARYALAALFGIVAVVFNPIAHIFAFSNTWHRSALALSALILAFSRRKKSLALALFFAFMIPTVPTQAADLSKYRSFQLGTDLTTVAKQAGLETSQVRVMQQRPALIQEIEWRPQPLMASSETEPAKNVVLTFLDGTLFRIVIDYDRYTTEGMSVDDMVEAISAKYGPAVKTSAPLKAAERSYGDTAETLAQWQDAEFRFELVRSAYGSGYKLIGVLKRLEGPAQAAVIEAAKMDDKQAPQRELDRVAKEKDAERVRLDAAKLVNKPKFQP